MGRHASAEDIQVLSNQTIAPTDSVKVANSEGPHFKLLKSVLQSTWKIDGQTSNVMTEIPVIPILLPGAFSLLMLLHIFWEIAACHRWEITCMGD